jgi:hypothetical protein
MSEIKHTPGPWQLGFNRQTNRITIFDKHAVNVAYIQPGDKISEQAEADARLIAAAPQLLTALETALRELTQWQHLNPEDEDLPVVIDEVKDAIKKTI